MKKRYILIPILVLMLIFSVFVILNLTLGYHMEISSISGVDIPISCKMEVLDTHGTRNEGETYAKVYFTEKKAKKAIQQIKKNQNWKKLPMYEKLQNSIENFEYFDSNIQIPQNGYWFFFNRYKTYSSKFQNPHNRYDEKEIYTNYDVPYNYSVAIYDTDNNVLSYYSTDM